MKYLKTYETNQNNYAILEIENNKQLLLWIIEIIDNFGVDGKWIKYTIRFIYKNNILSDAQLNYPNHKPLYALKEKILYKSDNLEDCINMVEIISNTRDYNL